MNKTIFFLGTLFFWWLFPRGTSCHLLYKYTDDTREGEPADDIVSERPTWLELARCDDLPGETNAIIANFEVTGAIVCDDSPKRIVVNMGSEVLIRAEHDLAISGIQFVVAPGARLIFMAGGSIIFARSQAMEGVPVLSVQGLLAVSAGKHVPGESKYSRLLPLGQQENQQDLLKTYKYSGVYYSSGQEVVFTANAIVVADEVDHSSEATYQQADKIEDLPGGAKDEPVEKENVPDMPDADVTTDYLNQGDTLRDGSLVSSDGAVELWAGMRGSVFFAKHLAAKKLSEDGKASRRMEVSTLIPANPSKVKGVLNIRARLKKEAEGGRRAKRNVFGWTPWRRGYNAQVDMARKQLGQVDMAVDDKGCLEVTVDGCCVLSKSGSHPWEWVNKLTCRKRCPAGYRLKVVENGLEVQLDSDKVWRVTLPETDHKKLSEGRSFFGVTAADIL